MKKNYYFFISTAVLAAVNIYAWQITLQNDYQLAWIAFLLVWINLAIAWIVYNKSEVIMYFFLSCSLIIELILIINNFWIGKI